MAAVALRIDDDLDCLPRAAGPAAKLQECVLLIEDNEEAMWLVRYALQEHGKGRYRLEWAGTLSAGLDQLSKGGIDIVLLDLGLPDSTGPEELRLGARSLPESAGCGFDRQQLRRN